MAITRAQESTPGTYDQANGTPYQVSATWDAATTAGNLLVAMVGFSLIPSGGTDITPPAGWTLIGREDNASQGSIVIYAREQSTSRSGSETFVLGAARDAVAELVEYSTDEDHITFDVVGDGATGTSTTPSSGAVTPTAAGPLLRVAGLINRNDNPQSSPGGGFSLVAMEVSPNASAANKMSVGAYEQIHTSGAAATASATIGSSRPWAGLQAIFREVPTSAATPPTVTAAQEDAAIVTASGTPGDGGALTYSIAQTSGPTHAAEELSSGVWSIPRDATTATVYQITVTEAGNAQTDTADVTVAVAGSSGTSNVFLQTASDGIVPITLA